MLVTKKSAVLFFLHLDFTFVYPSEIIAFSKRVDELQEVFKL